MEAARPVSVAISRKKLYGGPTEEAPLFKTTPLPERRIGLIGGSGLSRLADVPVVGEHRPETPYGEADSPVVEMELEGHRFFYIPRHGRGHRLLPHQINYRANIYSLKKLGVHYAVSLSAVGSLKEELPPGKLVLVDQFIDGTKGLRKRTFFREGAVAHVSTAYPVEKKLQEMVAGVCRRESLAHHEGGTYIAIEGPQFSSKAESRLYRQWGASVVGMTNLPEAYLAKEAGMAYATVAMVTDYDCWRDSHCSVEEILKTMEQNNRTAQKLVRALIPRLSRDKFEFEKENRLGLLTPFEKLSPENRAVVATLFQ